MKRYADGLNTADKYAAARKKRIATNILGRKRRFLDRLGKKIKDDTQETFGVNGQREMDGIFRLLSADFSWEYGPVPKLDKHKMIQTMLAEYKKSLSYDE